MVNKTSICWSSVAFGGKIDMDSQLSVFLRANFSNPNRAVPSLRHRDQHRNCVPTHELKSMLLHPSSPPKKINNLHIHDNKNKN